ncbi:MAG: ATP synthase F1 subunit epsilon [Lachnospiraceae bacterium]|nr:ATP synthase F1 subunit epsilon [Lachnospiraceae bacterium]
MEMFQLKIVASNRTFYEGPCPLLILTVHDGEMGIMAHHENMLVSVPAGSMRFQKENGEWEYAVVGVGLAEILNNHVNLLVETIERPEEIDLRRAEQARERAAEELRQKLSQRQYHLSKASMARATARIREKNRHKINGL